MNTQLQSNMEHGSLRYDDNHAHLSDELRKLDLLIQKRVFIFRQGLQCEQGAADYQSTCITHDQIDEVLSESGSVAMSSPELKRISIRIDGVQEEINVKLQRSLEKGVFLTLPQLAYTFGLSPLELQVIIICLASELHRKYDKLYAYLQDDITRKKPSVDLVLDLLCETQEDKWLARANFSACSPLFVTGLLQKVNDPQSPSGSSGLSQFIELDQRVLHYILGNNSIDERLFSVVELMTPTLSLDDIPVDPVIKMDLLNLTGHHFSSARKGNKRLVLNLHGPYGVGKRELALGLCAQLKCPLLYLDMELLLAEGSDLPKQLRLAFREALLQQAAVYLDHADVLLSGDHKSVIKPLAKHIATYGWLTFLSGKAGWKAKGAFIGSTFQSLKLPVPNATLREAVWEKALETITVPADEGWATQLARAFRLTPGQIQDAVEWAKNRRAMAGVDQRITMADLLMACREQSNQKLGELSFKIQARYGWKAIILPEKEMDQLQEICSHVKYRYQVFSEWGFDRQLSRGKGLSVLFSGPPGTGKTMAAEVIAHELQLNLYKIDLSSVVSKYIGETEKNLAKIFLEAETSNAILFFDEADALFGKRTEVSDAHDRYANIETSYLLQKMEEYEGMVILATNLRGNMDDAFTRRLRFIVEFSFPDEASRVEIWKSHFPREAPIDEGIDYGFLSRQFPITGGSIKNIVLTAAFLAAENGQDIGMEHILSGTQREFEKSGKLWDETHVFSLLN